MTLDCNHDCTKCPAYVPYGGQTSCRIINKVLIKAGYDIEIAQQLLKNAVKEGERNDKNI